MKTFYLPLILPNVSLEVVFDTQTIHAANYRVDKKFFPVDAQKYWSEAEHAAAKRIERALSSYWKDPTKSFKLSLAPKGTPFQQRVWQIMLDISTGKTRTYGEVANMLNSSPRAVGQACGANPLPLFIPCHRIVAAKGLGGFSHQREGAMIAMKKALLQHEGALP